MNTNINTNEVTRKLFDGDEIHSEERGFLEDLLEALPLVVDSEDTGNTTEYFDEDGGVLFCVDVVADDLYLFRFYETQYPVTEDILQKIKEILN